MTAWLLGMDPQDHQQGAGPVGVQIPCPSRRAQAVGRHPRAKVRLSPTATSPKHKEPMISAVPDDPRRAPHCAPLRTGAVSIGRTPG